MNDELKGAGERGFERGDIDLAIALAGVTVTNLKECAGRMHGDEERGAGHEFLVIEVARVDSGRGTVHLASRLGRGDAHASEKRLQRQIDSISKVTDRALAVERDDFRLPLRKDISQKTGPAGAGTGVRN